VRLHSSDGSGPNGRRRQHRNPRAGSVPFCDTALGRAARTGAGALALWLGLAPGSAVGQAPRDRSANLQITEIVSGLYAKQRYAEAEEALLGVIRACAAECSPAMLARAWMYAGVAEGSGMGDQRAARESFDNALEHDPNVAIDRALANPETLATFETARHEIQKRAQLGPRIAVPSAGDEHPSAAAPAPVKPKGGGLVCTPSAREIQTRRPIPFECRADREADRVSLRYREHAQAPWTTLELARTGDVFRATLPCDVTMNSGRLELFIVAADNAGDPLDTLGSKNSPLVLVLNPASDVAPAYPGEAAPERCAERVLCPPDFPGCADGEGDSVVSSGESQRPSRDWVSLHFAADVGFVGGSNVCTSSNADYDCFESGADTPYPGPLPATVAARPGELGDAYPGTEIGSGASVGTLRLMLGYEHALNDRVSVGGRLGYAFRGGPTTLDGDGFLPVHVEGKLAWWPRGLWASGLRPFLQFGAGFAEVDLKRGGLAVSDCTEEPGRQAFLDCIAADGEYAPANAPDLPSRTLDAYRKLGNAFVEVGAGLSLPIGGRAAVQLNLNALLMLPSVGVVLQPSLGMSYGL
jgi:hypothetical protein